MEIIPDERQVRKAHRMRKGTLALIGLLLIVAAASARADEVAEGRAIYIQYCASCHGVSGAGDGPLARLLTTPPTNLRRLSERYGNPLPEEKIAPFIDGRADVKAHGPRDMPVWGRRFNSGAQGDEQAGKDLIAKLVVYLQSIQTGPRSASRD